MKMKMKVNTDKMNALVAKEVIEAIDYMYGLGDIREAKKRLEKGEYSREEIYEAIAWYRADGIEPFAKKKEWIEKAGLPEVIKDYEKVF